MNYRAYINGFSDSHILIIGDLLLDEYVYTQVDRISPEAPVQVCLVNEKRYHLGGSGNVANNISSLGGKVYPINIAGNDESGDTLKEIFRAKGWTTDGLLQVPRHKTTVKSRIMAHNQQLLRMDNEEVGFTLSPHFQKKVIDLIEKYAPLSQAIILEDYGKGMITRGIIKKSIEIALKYEIPILVDPKAEHFNLYKNITIMTPNHIEAAMGSKIRYTGPESLKKIGRKLLKDLKMEALLITQGGEGMSLFESMDQITHIPTLAKEVYDVTGAGDTVIALMALCLSLNREDFLHASIMANIAAGIVVGKVGTATVGPEELYSHLVENGYARSEK